MVDGPPSQPRVSIAPAPPASARGLSLHPGALAPGKPRRTGWVLSGGGARGAYEVGVLSYIFQELPRYRGGKVPKMDVLCGTSVGAINACYLAGRANDPVHGMRRLVDMWLELELTKVLGFGLRQALGLPRVLLGGGQNAQGLFDVSPMAQLIEREVGWRAVSRNLGGGHLKALSISTTEVSTGRTVIWMQTGRNVSLPNTAPPRTLIRQDHIGTQHALASAAIPLLFPPVSIGNEFYCDGGLRLNTPISPALRLGATHILAIALTREISGLATAETNLDHNKPLGAASLLGKVLNAFLLDHLVNDLDVLARINGLLQDGESVFGEQFVSRVSERALIDGREPYRQVNCLAIKPTEDIGALAAVHVAKGRFRGNPLVGKQLLKLLSVAGDREADLASYLLFDGGFAKKLIDMGRADAAARRDDLLAFFDRDDERQLGEDAGDHEPSTSQHPSPSEEASSRSGRYAFTPGRIVG